MLFSYMFRDVDVFVNLVFCRALFSYMFRDVDVFVNLVFCRAVVVCLS